VVPKKLSLGQCPCMLSFMSVNCIKFFECVCVLYAIKSCKIISTILLCNCVFFFNGLQFVVSFIHVNFQHITLKE
jgi:hypothetical protein